MRILGIDPGTNSVGVALWDSENDVVLERDIIKAEAKDWVHRCGLLAMSLGVWLGALKRKEERPNMVVLELPTRNHNTIIQISWACGQLADTCQVYGIAAVHPIPAQHVKTWLGIRPGTRREIAKAAMRNYVNARFELGIYEAEQDAADAIVIAMAGYHYWKEAQL